MTVQKSFGGINSPAAQVSGLRLPPSSSFLHGASPEPAQGVSLSGPFIMDELKQLILQGTQRDAVTGFNWQ